MGLRETQGRLFRVLWAAGRVPFSPRFPVSLFPPTSSDPSATIQLTPGGAGLRGRERERLAGKVTAHAAVGVAVGKRAEKTVVISLRLLHPL